MQYIKQIGIICWSKLLHHQVDLPGNITYESESS